MAGINIRTSILSQILSKYFEKGLAFSIWTGSSQFGDFIALSLGDLLV